MIGSVSCVIDGVPALFTLHDSRVWEVDHAGIEDVVLGHVMRRLDDIVDQYAGPSAGPFGPSEVRRAAELLRGTPYVVPTNPPPEGVIH